MPSPQATHLGADYGASNAPRYFTSFNMTRLEYAALARLAAVLCAVRQDSGLSSISTATIAPIPM
jgi:hypothetical protein